LACDVLEGGEALKIMLVLLFAVLATGCASGSLFVGNTELSERELQRLLAQLPDTVRLESAYESKYLIRESTAAYENLAVVTPGRVRIAGSVFENKKPIIIDIAVAECFAPGESKEIGTDYFVYLLPSPVGKNFQAVISRHHPDWVGYFSPGAGTEPGMYSHRTWKLLGYFHMGPRGRILHNSVATNSNLNDPPAGVPLPGMVKAGSFAIDIYENSDLNGHCISAYGRRPITGVTCDEAQAMAGLCGKRLPTSRQWLGACDPETFPQVLSTKPREGNALQNTWSKKVAPAGEFAAKNAENFALSGCVDMVGNVWEWCDEIIELSALTDLPTTKTGYIAQITTYMRIPRWPSVTSTKRLVESFGYFFVDPALKQAGLARGASCEEGDKAGTASLLLSVDRRLPSPVIGFRCVR
jgi:hypothetical protein